MNDLLNKLAAIIEWAEQHGADEPHKLACEAMDLAESLSAAARPWLDACDAHDPTVDAMYDGVYIVPPPVVHDDDHIHPDQAVS
jgi:hypothetical protein